MQNDSTRGCRSLFFASLALVAAAAAAGCGSTGDGSNGGDAQTPTNTGWPSVYHANGNADGFNFHGTTTASWSSAAAPSRVYLK